MCHDCEITLKQFLLLQNGWFVCHSNGYSRAQKWCRWNTKHCLLQISISACKIHFHGLFVWCSLSGFIVQVCSDHHNRTLIRSPVHFWFYPRIQKTVKLLQILKMSTGLFGVLKSSVLWLALSDSPLICITELNGQRNLNRNDINKYICGDK